MSLNTKVLLIELPVRRESTRQVHSEDNFFLIRTDEAVTVG
ncbi:hypothetical protein [Mariniblastus fucicola]|nr:hypothetical protein [Mariniblastus fucicola]